jgi:hypothetical protein
MQTFRPSEISLGGLNTMLDQLAAWTNALMPLRLSAAVAD